MNQETIKAAEEYAKTTIFNNTAKDAFLAGAEYKQKGAEEAIRIAVEYAVNEKQKEVDEKQQHIDELVAFVKHVRRFLPGPEFDKASDLIQKHKR
jgi:hypothetical protein